MIVRVLKKTLKWFFLSTILSVIIFRFIPIVITPYIIVSSINQIADNDRTFRVKKKWTCINDMSPNIQKAAIAAEDQKFEAHFGFDIYAIKKARAVNKKGGKIYGGSTITQQTAKNLFLLHSRNYLRKGLEAYFTLLMELLWSKKKIMEVYLNIIEFGDGIYGVEAASQVYFNKNISEINKYEAALLIAVLPNPKVYSVKNPSYYIRKRQNKIIREMKRIEPIEWLLKK